MTAYLIEFHRARLEAAVLPALDGCVRRLAYRAPAGVDVLVCGAFRLLVGRPGVRETRDASPFVHAHDGTVTIFDGRLDDRAGIFARLGRRTDPAVSDTELVSLLHEVDGPGFVERLRGEFTLAVMNPARAECIVARDPLGIRSVQYAMTPSGAVFSNELPAVMAHPDVDHALSDEAIADFLMFGSMDWHDKRRTAFAAVRHLVPGECALWQDGRLALRRYWTFPRESAATRLAPRDIAPAFRDVLDVAVRDRMSSSRVMLLMSGGLDSTSVAALAARHRSAPDAAAPLLARTTIGVPGSEEERVARIVARHIGVEHEVVSYPARQVLQPGYPTWGPVLTFIRSPPVAEMESWHRFDLVLHASAADNALTWELANFIDIARAYGFAHALHARAAMRRRGMRLPWGTGLGALLRGAAPGSGPVSAVPAHGVPDWIDPSLRRALALDERWAHEFRARPASEFHRTHPRLHYWFEWASWFRGNQLIGLAHAPPDGSDPFTDLRVLDFVLSLPASPWLDGKHLLREAMAGLLPDEARLRPKIAAGNFIAPMVEALPDEQIERWPAAPGLERYVVRSGIPPIDMAKAGRNGYLDLRPLMLNLWLNDLPRWLLR
jgi:asparagine synthase (glutamine-hydrolysing)